MILHWIALNTVKGLGPVRINKLLQRYETPENVFRQSRYELINSGGLSEEMFTALQTPSILSEAAEQMERARQCNVSILTLHDELYPPFLKEIFAPPPLLYVKGNMEVFKRASVAVVGTRSPTQYGKEVTKVIVENLAEKNVVVVSGLAHGIDTVAHHSCIKKKGFTIAVLGCGIDINYPAANADLAAQIERQGAIVSEFPMGTPPEPFNFPRRNRIISGLASAVLVVEAGEKSGSLITANYALQQNRDVFAVPGSIFSPMSAGTINLIKNGAIPLRKAEDIIESLTTIPNYGLNNCGHEPTPTFLTELLSDDERQVFEAVTNSPQRLDQLTEKTGKTIQVLFDVLLNLELKGMVKQIAGQQYVKV